ncbi:hypothetical protein BKA70DRAFT_720733 [Coprinopsis sp. MPI-PUGE-AT-0042]|nr:hypothetical protein BKA70DRAFT_720733 [Coprinopsis sp. MPI-PUGE-AT-0042]
MIRRQEGTACNIPCTINSFRITSLRRRARLTLRSKLTAESNSFRTLSRTIVSPAFSANLQEPEYKAEAPATSLLGNRELSSSPTPLLAESIVIHVQLECRSERQGVPTSTPQVRLKPNKADTPYFLYLTPISRSLSGSFPPACPTPRSTLSLFSSTVKLVSPFPLSEETAWTAYKGHTRIHQERTVIRMLTPAAG